MNELDSAEKKPSDFIREIITEDIRNGVNDGRVATRFPPEPNGTLHIGHAMAVNINYGIAREFGGTFNLRFDDTNPTKEKPEYIDGIIEDIKWLIADFGDRAFFASDYFDRMYEWAVALVKAGKAYVDSLSTEEIRQYRGTDLSGLKPGEKIETKPGKNSPYRERSAEENLDLFEKMKTEKFAEGEWIQGRCQNSYSGCSRIITPQESRIDIMDPVTRRPIKRLLCSWCRSEFDQIP